MNADRWNHFCHKLGDLLTEFGVSYDELYGGEDSPPIIMDENDHAIPARRFYCYASTGTDRMNLDLLLTFKDIEKHGT